MAEAKKHRKHANQPGAICGVKGRIFFAVGSTEVTCKTCLCMISDKTTEQGGGLPPFSDLILTDNGYNRINVIKVIRDLTGLGLKESKELSDQVMDGKAVAVLHRVSSERIEAARSRFAGVGATVMVVPSGSGPNGSENLSSMPSKDTRVHFMIGQQMACDSSIDVFNANGSNQFSLTTCEECIRVCKVNYPSGAAPSRAEEIENAFREMLELYMPQHLEFITNLNSDLELPWPSNFAKSPKVSQVIRWAELAGGAK